MRCPKCRNSVTVPTPAKKKGPQNRFISTAPAIHQSAPSETLESILERAAERGLLLKDQWLLLRCPSCEEWIKVRKQNFERLVSCGNCAYEFSVNIE